MKKSTFSKLAMLVAGGWLASNVAWAGPPPEPPRQGGIPQREESLLQCNTDLTQCSIDVAICEAFDLCSATMYIKVNNRK